MARGLNKVQLIGCLGGDPEIRYTTSGAAVANFSLATTEQWTKGGEKQSKTEWHKIVAWRKLAEVVGEWLKKGQLIYVEGKITTEKWQNKEGNDVYTTKIVIDQMIMLGGGQADGHHRAEPEDRPQPQNQGGDFSGGGEQRGFGGGFEGQQVPDDDIPF